MDRWSTSITKHARTEISISKFILVHTAYTSIYVYIIIYIVSMCAFHVFLIPHIFQSWFVQTAAMRLNAAECGWMRSCSWGETLSRSCWCWIPHNGWMRLAMTCHDLPSVLTVNSLDSVDSVDVVVSTGALAMRFESPLHDIAWYCTTITTFFAYTNVQTWSLNLLMQEVEVSGHIRTYSWESVVYVIYVILCLDFWSILKHRYKWRHLADLATWITFTFQKYVHIKMIQDYQACKTHMHRCITFKNM